MRSIEATGNQYAEPSHIKPIIDGIRRPLSYSPPRFTSAVSPWNGFLFEDTEIPSGNLSKITYRKPMLFLYTRGRAHAWAIHGGTRYNYIIRPGQLYILRGGHEIQRAYHSNSLQVVQLELDVDKLRPLSETYSNSMAHSLVPFLMTKDLQVADLIYAMYMEIKAGCPSGRIFGESISLALLCCIAQRYTFSHSKGTDGNREKLDLRTQRYIEDYIIAHLNDDISICEIAKKINMRPVLFSRMFSATFGMTPYKYIIRKRIEQAKTDLTLSEYRVIEVGKRWGFANTSHFTSTFRRITGSTPSQFRQMHW